MPSVMLAMANGRDPVSGLSFRKVTLDGSHRDQDSCTDDDGGEILRVNGQNGVERKESKAEKDQTDVEAIRMRLKKGRAGRPVPIISLSNNNAPMKAFPMNGSGVNSEISRNTNNSSLPNFDNSDSNTPGDNSVTEAVRMSNTRPPLQRIHGRGPQKQKLPPGLVDPEVPLGSNGNAEGTGRSSIPNPKIPATSTLPPTNAGNNNMNRSGLSRNGSATYLPSKVTHREAVTFDDHDLPPGMRELQKECFIPGVKGCFQHRTDIPLLISTDAAILKRRSSISQSKKNRIPTPTQPSKSKFGPRNTKHADGATMVRSRSTASEVFIQPDMEILKACWSIIQSFMGDDKPPLAKPHRTIGSIMSPKKKLWRKSSADIATVPKYSPMPSPTRTEESHRRPFSMFVLPPSKPGSTKPKKPTEKPPSAVQIEKKLPNSVSGLSIFDKVHFLMNAGLKLSHLRDEIYCLIMKQLVSNPSLYSTALGWILLALLSGTFLPSDKVLSYAEKFIDHHDHAWSKYCRERLKRTVTNGPRTNPPCSLEIQAAKSAKGILLPIICMDNSAMTVSVDSATTSKEMLESMTEKNRIGDPFGHCIVLKSRGQVVNLGSGRFPIMDALSQVEVNAGKKFAKDTCKLFYRRDVFSPRDMFSAIDDSMALRTTFFQVCGGVKTGEYFCNKAPDLTLLISHQYCIQYGLETVDERRVARFCEKSLPQDIYKSDKKSWCRMVVNTISALRRKQGNFVNPLDIMAQVIRYTMQNLKQHFVRKYRIMTFKKVNGVCTYTSELSLTLSHEGVTVRQGDAMKSSDPSAVEESEVHTVPVVLMEIPAANLKKVKLDTRGSKSGGTLTVTDCVGGSYEITSAHGPEIYSVLFRYIRDISRGANKESKA